MKKYSVFSLYVVQVGTGKRAHYFICEQQILFSNTYIEIFTKQKIKLDNEVFVKRLSDFYSILERCNFSTGEVLMLTKKQLLLKYIEINNYYTEKRVEEKYKNTYKKKK